MSTHGLFVYSSVLPPENTSIQVEVTFPPLQQGGPEVRLDVQGRVVRVERHATAPLYDGFAVSSEKTILRGGEHNGADEDQTDGPPGGTGG
jgi:hypothetical protein